MDCAYGCMLGIPI